MKKIFFLIVAFIVTAMCSCSVDDTQEISQMKSSISTPSYGEIHNLFLDYFEQNFDGDIEVDSLEFFDYFDNNLSNCLEENNGVISQTVSLSVDDFREYHDYVFLGHDQERYFFNKLEETIKGFQILADNNVISDEEKELLIYFTDQTASCMSGALDINEYADFVNSQAGEYLNNDEMKIYSIILSITTSSIDWWTNNYGDVKAVPAVVVNDAAGAIVGAGHHAYMNKDKTTWKSAGRAAVVGGAMASMGVVKTVVKVLRLFL